MTSRFSMTLPLTIPMVTLLAANLLPLLGVVFFGWDAGAVVLIYWMENLVIGGYTILKMLSVRMKSPAAHLGKLFIVPFFCIHYGGFCAVHGIFLFMFMGIGKDEAGGPSPLFTGTANELPIPFIGLLVVVVQELWSARPEYFEWPLFGLVMSHGVSFAVNYIGRGEYARLELGRLMGQPYGRIVVMHIAIIIGGVTVMAMGSPLPLLVLLVLLKVGMDVKFHVREHRKAQKVEGDQVIASDQPRDAV